LLLKHQSGIRHYRGDEVRSNTSYARVRDSFGVFQDDPLLFNPGERFSYTTYGYNVLGAAIEGASGEDYVSYVKKHICEPAGMETIRPDSPLKIIPHRAAGYRKSGPALINDIAVDVSNKIPGGGWCSTAGDLVRFARALAEGKLVDAQTLERMWTAQKTTQGKPTGAGYGCFIDTVDGDRLISHSGGQPKVSTYLVFSPARKTAVVLMCNLRGAGLKPLAQELIGVLGKVGAEEATPAVEAR
jgi:serine beta-lactamase-like protein LACTB, mitochondrial